tara:strand:+ start:665 stop:1117 length:453 start_codon:yes stop_codon:yes gene_type:complete
MNLGKLSPAKGSVKNSKRIGRGNATGQGRTAGKGHKGYKSRSGAGRKLHFEGGQTPLARRLPKRGMGNGKFNHLRTKSLIQIINLNDLNKINKKDITPELLYDLGLINKNNPYKVLGNGEIEKSINISANMFSKKAIEKIESAGGTISFI